MSANEWNASRLVGQARKLELVFAFGARLISTVRSIMFDCHFSNILVILGKKWLSPRKKFCNGKKFRFRYFCFKIRFKTFLIDFDRKNFGQDSLTLPFFYYFGHFGQKMTKSHEKILLWEKNFDFEIFVLRYVSKHSESFPTQKHFWAKNDVKL